ncbi:GrrA/OscA1 family cyclophane-containing rSAM-modified RiPP [Dapis sp. BLCC M126]|uniref:GrrA/OscA1 family cyclophane-containing rSAM-modified RiPP n=1 Tax=Dapis sp. BLCC M126 TaxID=3400189 RepID=UPI003CF4E1F1
MIKISTKSSWVGFLLALSTLNIPIANATENHPLQPTVENRLNRITQTIREKEEQVQEKSNIEPDSLAIGWRDGKKGRGWVNIGRSGWKNGRKGRGWVNISRPRWGDGRRGGWVNGRRGGWVDGRGGSFANVNPWRNGWRDGGGFYNYRR